MTSVAADVYELHLWMIGICVAIFIAVFGVMFYSILKHRKSLGHKAASFHESTAVEIAWTVVPFLIVVLMALTAFQLESGKRQDAQVTARRLVAAYPTDPQVRVLAAQALAEPPP